MMALKRIDERPGVGLALLTVEYFGDIFSHQLWSKVKAKKHGTCAETHTEYAPGTEVYRPLGNSRNRSQRILASEIDAPPNVKVRGCALLRSPSRLMGWASA